MTRAATVILCAAFLGLPALASRLEPNRYAGGRSRDAGARAERNASAVARLLGEFRTAASDIMFIKTERYLDSGIAYLPHVEREDLSAGAETAAARAGGDGHVHDEHCGHAHADDDGHAGTPTVIPTPERDFRGFIGWIHRQIKPWRDPSLAHQHTDGLELLPWFRMMTVADPGYVRGYAVGGSWLTHRNLEEGIRFVEEGLRNNPDSFEIWFTYGTLQLEKARISNDFLLTPVKAENLPRFLAARDAFRNGAEEALKRRPAGWTADGDRAGTWTDYMEEDARGSARMAVLCEKNYGDPDEAVRLAIRYVRALGPDQTMDRTIQESNARAGAQGP